LPAKNIAVPAGGARMQSVGNHPFRMMTVAVARRRLAVDPKPQGSPRDGSYPTLTTD